MFLAFVGIYIFKSQLVGCDNLTSTLAAMKRHVMPMSCSVDLKTFVCVAMKRSK